MVHADPDVAHQFNDAVQQREAATFGMWLFLATEVLFFGGLFLAYTVYRYSYPEAFRHASSHTLVVVGTINTAILLISSFCMVLAVQAAEQTKRFALFSWLTATAVLGVLFLVIKGFEYHHEIQQGLFPGPNFHFEGPDRPQAKLFFCLYFVMTGIHALHVIIGIFLIGTYAVWALYARRLEPLRTSVDLLGLYWHFVDIVWVFLFPLIYLIGRHA